MLACGSVGAAYRPNVVLFVVDDMGWMDSEPYGSKYYETPNMTKLAKQSMRFTDAYAVPLCSPTRCSILSGQHSARHGITSASGHQPPAPADAPRYPEKAGEQRFFITAAGWVPDSTRTFFLRTPSDGGHATRPIILHVKKREPAS